MIKPYSPQTLADHWGCSAEKIRLMCKDGELSSFTLGKLIRIPASEVERVECQNIDSPNIEESSPLLGTKQGESNRFESRRVRLTEGLPKAALVNSGKPELPQSQNG